MKELFKRFSEIEKEMAAERGEFTLLGLFQRDTTLFDRWDVVVSADWLGEDEYEAMKYIIPEFQKRLTKEQWLMVSGVQVLKPNEAFVEEMLEEVREGNGNFKVSNFDFNGMTLTRGIIIAPKQAVKREAAAQAGI